MREIKFRVYDEDYKKMRYLNDLHDSITFRENGNAYYHNMQTGLGEWFSDLMQYTGLKDKNGVEIYEGDIIEQGAMLFKIEYNIKVIGFVLVPIREYVFDYMPVNVENHLPGQVIGNIYENKELLGE